MEKEIPQSSSAALRKSPRFPLEWFSQHVNKQTHGNVEIKNKNDDSSEVWKVQMLCSVYVHQKRSVDHAAGDHGLTAGLWEITMSEGNSTQPS